jgi:hypothetical protein
MGVCCEDRMLAARSLKWPGRDALSETEVIEGNAGTADHLVWRVRNFLEIPFL